MTTTAMTTTATAPAACRPARSPIRLWSVILLLLAGVAGSALAVPAPARAAVGVPLVSVELPPRAGSGWHVATPTATITVESDDDLGPSTWTVRNGSHTRSGVLGVGTTQVIVTEQGTSELSWSVRSSTGRTASGSTVVRVDTEPPTVVLEAPTTVDLGQRVIPRFTCDDVGAGLAACALFGPLDGGAMLNSTPGRHEFEIQAVDGAGHLTVVRHAYTVAPHPDRTPPVVALTALGSTEGHGDWWWGPVQGAVTALDPTTDPMTAVSGVDHLLVGLNGATPVAVPGEHAGYEFTEGVTTVEYTAVDRAGNRAVPRTETVFVDATPPVVATTFPVSGQHLAAGDTRPAVATCTDATSGITACGADTDLDRTPGDHAVTFTAIDAAGHRTRRTVRYVVDPALTDASTPGASTDSTLGTTPGTETVAPPGTVPAGATLRLRARPQAGRRSAAVTVILSGTAVLTGTLVVLDGPRSLVTRRVTLTDAPVRMRLPRLAVGRHRLQARLQLATGPVLHSPVIRVLTTR